MNYTGIFGFDISTWQDSPDIPGGVDFLKMYNSGARFVIVKAGQGSWKDPDFDKNWQGCKDVLPRATYFYYDNRYPPKEQARKYYDIIKADPEGMCWLDLEDKTAGVYAGWRNWYDFITEMEWLYPGVKIGIYTGFYYWTESMKYATTFQIEWFKQFPLWLAWYFPDALHPDYSRILIPPPWDEYLILQSGTPAIGRMVGVESEEIDYNQLNGDALKFYHYFKPIEMPEQPGEPMKYEINTPSTSGVALRPDHNTNNTAYLYIPAGTMLTSDSIFTASVPLGTYQYVGDKWAQVTYGGKTGWVALIHKGAQICTYRELQPPPVEPPGIAIPDYLIAHFPDGAEKKYVPE